MPFTISTLIECAGRRWSPQIGDPSLMGWITVAAYALTAVLALAAISRSRSRLETWFWGLAGVFLICLAVNKQLDLQSGLTALGRCLSQAQGWYDARRDFQQRFIYVLLACAMVVTIGLIWGLWRIMPRIWLALLGVLMVMTFVAVRAVSFHHMDAVLNLRIHDIRMNWVLELSGLVLIALNVLVVFLRRPPPVRRTRHSPASDRRYRP